MDEVRCALLVELTVPSSLFLARPAVEPDRPLRVSEAAARLGVTEATVRRWIASGLLPARRVGPGRRILIDRADMERLFSTAGTPPVGTDETGQTAANDGPPNGASVGGGSDPVTWLRTRGAS